MSDSLLLHVDVQVVFLVNFDWACNHEIDWLSFNKCKEVQMREGGLDREQVRKGWIRRDLMDEKRRQKTLQ